MQEQIHTVLTVLLQPPTTALAMPLQPAPAPSYELRTLSILFLGGKHTLSPRFTALSTAAETDCGHHHALDELVAEGTANDT